MNMIIYNIVCKECGYIHPNDYPRMICCNCKAPLDVIVCRECGCRVSGEDRVKTKRLCRDCHNDIERAHMVPYLQKRDGALNKQYKSWLAKINKVPKDYPTITEEQWREACNFFGGCARCGSPDIDTRAFFIDPKNGGRYCNWNVIPSCGKCLGSWDNTKNPFYTAMRKDRDAMYRKDGSYTFRNCLDNIVEYLGAKLDKALEDKNE